MTIEESIAAKFIEKLQEDQVIPKETVERIAAMWKEGKAKDPDAILDVIKQGAKAHGQNPAS